MNVLRTALVKNIRPSLNLSNPLKSTNCYHSLLNRVPDTNVNSVSKFNGQLLSLLKPVSIMNTQISGFKFKSIVKKRCKDCYIVVKDRQKIVLCSTHRRHKQKEIVPAEKDTYIVTHRTHGKIRPW